MYYLVSVDITAIVKQHEMGVDSSDIMIAAIQKRHQSELEVVHREVEMFQQKCKLV